jgi:23S rRNA pseudouridine2605 synthase
VVWRPAATYPPAMRLAKYLATAGVASRRAAEELIRAGRVTVDGELVADPARDVSEQQRVQVDGESVAAQPERAVYLVNKPAGVVSTARDPQGRPTVVELLPSSLRLYPVGRLDADTTGLILLTNDGELANRLTHPRYEVDKTYRAVVANPPVARRAVGQLRQGVALDDGPTAPARVRATGPDTLEITIHEGRKRQVRRMCQAVGHPVKSLERIAFGPLQLGDLPPGQTRRLTVGELRRLASAGRAARPGAGSSYRARGPRSEG